MGSVAMLTITGLLSQGVGFVYRALLARAAGAEVLGLYQLILPVYAVLTSLTSAGLNTGVSNLSARYQALGNRRAVYQVRGQAVRLFLLLAVVPCVLLEVFSDAASVWLLGDARTRLGLMLLVPCLLFTGIENLQKHYFYGTGRVAPAAVTELLEQMLRAALCLGCLWTLRPQTPEGAVGAVVLGMALCEVAAALTQTLLFRLSIGPRKGLTGQWLAPAALRGQLLRIAGPLGLAALLGNLLSSANALLIPRLLVQGGVIQSEAVSAYGVVFGMTLPMLMIPTAFLSALSLVLTPKLAQYAALGDQGAIRRGAARAVGAANLILMPALALLAVLGEVPCQTLYRDHRAGELLPLLALGVLFSCWHGLSACVLTGVGKQGTSAAIALLCDGVQLGLTLLTVSRWGLAGYAASFAATALLGAVWAWRAAARVTGLTLPVFPWFIGPVLGSSLAAACGSLMETILLRGGLDPLPAALGGMGFGVLLYLAALGAMGVTFPRRGDEPPRPRPDAR